MKKVLLLCTSHNDLGLIRGLRKLGYYIIATGNRENSPGEKWVDKWIRADYSNKELILDIAKEEKIDSICACCNDFGVYTATYVAEKLGLPGYDDYETTLILHNKDKFNEFSKKYNIRTPLSNDFSNSDHAKSELRNMRLPVIVKPVDCSAGNGISVVESYEEGDSAIDIAFSKSRSSRIVIEPYIKGTQHGFCTFLVDQKVVAVCSNNEYSIINPFRVEIDTYPADNWKECSQKLIEQIEKMASILKLKDGIFHLQYIYSDGEPWIIEVMRRTLGNMYHVLGNQLNGFQWEYWEARARCGLDCKGFPKNAQQEGFFAYKTILAPNNGIIDRICIPDIYKRYIFDEFYLMGSGDEVKDYKSQPVGFLFFMFSSDEEMKSVLIENYKSDLVKMI